MSPLLKLGSHTGTHVDAPFHFVEGGTTIDRVPLDVLVGECYRTARSARSSPSPSPTSSRAVARGMPPGALQDVELRSLEGRPIPHRLRLPRSGCGGLAGGQRHRAGRHRLSLGGPLQVRALIRLICACSDSGVLAVEGLDLTRRNSGYILPGVPPAQDPGRRRCSGTGDSCRDVVAVPRCRPHCRWPAPRRGHYRVN